MTDERELRDALRAIAETDPIDEPTRWAAITAAVETEPQRRQRRRRIAMLGGAGLAVLGAAAALVVVAAGDDPRREVVDAVTPASEPARTTQTTRPTTTTGVAETNTSTSEVVDVDPSSVPEPIPTTGPVPEHPLLLVRRAGSANVIDVYDADTGQLLGTPVVTSGSPSDPQLGPDGTLWYTRLAGSLEDADGYTAVERVAWGSTEPERPFGRDTIAPALSPDGTMLAFERTPNYDVYEPWPVIIVDLRTGLERVLEWVDDEATNIVIRRPEWSADGERLLLNGCVDGCGAMVVPRTADSFSPENFVTSFAEEFDFVTGSWLGADKILMWTSCCYGSAEQSMATVSEGDGRVGDPLDLGPEPILDVDGSFDGRIVILRESGVVEIREPSGQLRQITVPPGVTEVELS